MSRFFRASLIVSALVLSACVDRNSAPLTAPGGVRAFTGGTANAAAASLSINVQPRWTTSTYSGEPLVGETGPYVEVYVLDALDGFATDQPTVSVSLVNASAGMVLVGGPIITVPAESGTATFDNLVVTGEGTANLVFTAGALTPAASEQFTIACFGGPGTCGGGGGGPTPPSLVVARQPSADAVSGVEFIGQPIIEVREQAAPGAISHYADGKIVRATINSGSGTLEGTTDATVTDGVATFTNLKINGVGTFTLAFNTVGLFPELGTVTSANVVVRLFDWTGFFKPIDNLPTVNKNQAGSTIPIKFNLGGNKGLNIFLPGYPASQTVVSCTDFTPTGTPTAIVRENGPALIYDDGGKYQVDWKTDKTWTGCRVLIVKLIDGSTHTANFSFKK